MTTYTAPDSLPIPEAGDDLTPLEQWFEDEMLAVQTALLRPGVVANEAARKVAIPTPVAGQSVWRTDKGYREMYLTAPTVRTSGWFPMEGVLPTCRLWRSATYSFTTAGYGLPFDVTKRMTQGAVSFASGNASNMTVNYSGLWRISVTVAVPATTSYANIKLFINGTSYMTAAASGNANNTTNVVLDTDLELTAGDVLQVVLHSNTNLTNVSPFSDAGQATFMSLTYLGPA